MIIYYIMTHNTANAKLYLADLFMKIFLKQPNLSA